VGKPLEKKLFRGPKRRWEDKIKMETGCDDGTWMKLP
jgi:hypothetical protein